MNAEQRIAARLMQRRASDCAPSASLVGLNGRYFPSRRPPISEPTGGTRHEGR